MMFGDWEELTRESSFEWKCQQCDAVATIYRGNGERVVEQGVFGIPVGWTKIVRSNVFHVVCSWDCLVAFATFWRDASLVDGSDLDEGNQE